MYNPVTPRILKRIFESLKYKSLVSDDICWMLENKGHVVVINQTMKLVPSDVIESMAGPAEITEEKFNQLAIEAEKPTSATTAQAVSASQPQVAAADPLPPITRPSKFPN